MQRQTIGFVLPKTDTVARIFKAALIFKTQGINSKQNVPYSLAGASRFFVYLGILSQTFAIHRTSGEGGDYFFISSVQSSPVSQTLRHWLCDYCVLISIHS